tara:strand:- start:284 stop:508 length:225 start_codon:yes stop_codon:yes gene_type:complete
MKITVISWKDERWSADKEALKSINKLINKNTNKMKYPIGERIFTAVGWIAISPFVIREYVIRGFKWAVKKIKKK